MINWLTAEHGEHVRLLEHTHNKKNTHTHFQCVPRGRLPLVSALALTRQGHFFSSFSSHQKRKNDHIRRSGLVLNKRNGIHEVRRSDAVFIRTCSSASCVYQHAYLIIVVLAPCHFCVMSDAFYECTTRNLVCETSLSEPARTSFSYIGESIVGTSNSCTSKLFSPS